MSYEYRAEVESGAVVLQRVRGALAGSQDYESVDDSEPKRIRMRIKGQRVHTWGEDAILEAGPTDVYLQVYGGERQDRERLVAFLDSVLLASGCGGRFEEI